MRFIASVTNRLLHWVKAERRLSCCKIPLVSMLCSCLIHHSASETLSFHLQMDWDYWSGYWKRLWSSIVGRCAVSAYRFFACLGLFFSKFFHFFFSKKNRYWVGGSLAAITVVRRRPLWHHREPMLQILNEMSGHLPIDLDRENFEFN